MLEKKKGFFFNTVNSIMNKRQSTYLKNRNRNGQLPQLVFVYLDSLEARLPLSVLIWVQESFKVPLWSFITRLHVVQLSVAIERNPTKNKQTPWDIGVKSNSDLSKYDIGWICCFVLMAKFIYDVHFNIRMIFRGLQPTCDCSMAVWVTWTCTVGTAWECCGSLKKRAPPTQSEGHILWLRGLKQSAHNSWSSWNNTKCQFQKKTVRHARLHAGYSHNKKCSSTFFG